MPEPNTVTDPNGGDPPNESTAGWVPAAASGPEPAVASTVTRTVASTPGPADPERLTLRDRTERIDRLAADDPTRPPEIPGYFVEKCVGKGGMGVVYRAIDLTLNRVVALKVLHPGGRDYQHVIGRFDREVTALAAIDHPNIVRIYHAGDWHGFPYFTMQFVAGGPLSHHLARFRGDPPACARLMAKVARAVQVLHDRQVIHRDLKPLNILLRGDEPMVADFGLAKWLDDPQPGHSVTGHPVGTRQYMAPEQTTGKPTGYTPACDIWALGVVLYELLSGRRPFPDDGKSDLYKRIREEPTPSLPEEVPAELAAVVEKCLEKHPADRYPTAAAVADDLEAWLRGESLPNRPARRTRGWVLAAALLALVGLIALPAVAMIAGTPAPAPKTPTLAERLANGETVYVTDGKGRPFRTPVVIARQTLFTGLDEDGDYTFRGFGPGMARVLDEPLPRPLRVECELTMPHSDDGLPHEGGLFLGEKTWPGGAVGHASALRFVIGPADPTARFPRPLKSSITLHHRRDDRNLGNSAFASNLTSWADGPRLPDRPRVVRVKIVLTPDEVRATIDGHEFAPLSADKVLRRLRDDMRGDPQLGNYPFALPVLGDGIGITLNNTELVVRNLRLTRSDN